MPVGLWRYPWSPCGPPVRPRGSFPWHSRATRRERWYTPVRDITTHTQPPHTHHHRYVHTHQPPVHDHIDCRPTPEVPDLGSQALSFAWLVQLCARAPLPSEAMMPSSFPTAAADEVEVAIASRCSSAAGHASARDAISRFLPRFVDRGGLKDPLLEMIRSQV